jgi:nitrate/nitrite transport system permease protein
MMSAVTQLKPKASVKATTASVTQLPTQPRKGLAMPRWTHSLAVNVLPPTIVLLAILALWEVAFSAPGANLPTPSIVWMESSDLILDPF